MEFGSGVDLPDVETIENIVRSVNGTDEIMNKDEFKSETTVFPYEDMTVSETETRSLDIMEASGKDTIEVFLPGPGGPVVILGVLQFF